MASMTFDSPTKKSTKRANIIDDRRRSPSPASLEDEDELEEDEKEVAEQESEEAKAARLAELSERFVGEIELPESACHSFFFSQHVNVQLCFFSR